MTIKLVTFDLDDTLWNPAAALQRAERACYEFITAECPQLASLYDLEGLRQYRIDLGECYPSMAQQVSKLRIESLRRAVMQTGIKSEPALELAEAAFAVFYRERSQLELFEQTLPLLQSLTRRLPVIAVTNGNADLQLAGVDDYFQACITADDIGIAKPAPDMFHAALNHQGIEPHECIHIGDHPHNDVDAARQLGIHAIWTPLYQQDWPAELAAPQYVAEKLEQLDALIHQLELQYAS
ncbi:HAD family hydrolase [Oceanobacter mangrovi]|uniref:HAD family hydrolase n=1 Tax=Oceanobacter mangrovi TaxID=2862510 RepID=UPI001C8DE5A9|nr:HAD family hydrolase [Oceanobacter mangrovi]